ncbi:hypothetical protein I6M33_07310 [Shewanella algae]|uniref:hypothetical protein n=1 Tax=Shewanella algae TaxID=38313 RepID=UPI001AAD5AB1|nr:hypothetical protein [Shewanella algae]MBO2560430.1 hypothetical protein [Shewanella algae]MBO2619743.1 hypothetical protein [Shewanella algae]
MKIALRILSNKLVQNTLATILFRLSILIMGVIFARNLGAELYGEFVLVRSTVQILETALGISLGIAVSKVFLINKDVFISVVNSSVCFIATVNIFAFIVFVVLFDISDFSGANIFVVFFYSIVTLFFQFFLNFLKGVGDFKLVFTVSIVYLISTLVVSYCLTLSMSGANSAVISYIVILCTSFATMLILGFKWFLKLELKLKFKLVDVLSFYKLDAFPVMLSAMLSPLIVWLVNILIASGDNGIHDLSLFNVSYLLYGLMTFFPVVLAETYFKRIAEEIKNNSNVFNLLCKYSVVLLLLNIPLSLFFYCFSKDILLLYGEAFLASLQSFRLFILCSFLTCTLPLLGKLFILSGFSFFNLISNVIWGGLVLGFVLFGRYYFSVDTPLLCAISISFSYFIVLVMQWSVAYKRFAK